MYLHFVIVVVYVVVEDVVIDVGLVGGLTVVVAVAVDVGKLVKLAADVTKAVIEAAVVELSVVELWEIGEVSLGCVVLKFIIGYCTVMFANAVLLKFSFGFVKLYFNFTFKK